MSSRDNGKRAALLGLTALLMCASIFGCAPKSSHGTVSGPSHVQPAASDGGEVEVSTVDRQGYDAVVAKHRGKVVLVDFWATWCLPCIEQLPHTLELGRRFGDGGLAVVTVSCDEPAESDRVAKLLSSKQASGATNLISQFGGSPRTMEEFEITSGAVPFYKLYDRKGQLRQTFGIDPVAKKQFTPAEIDAAIEQLLAERG